MLGYLDSFLEHIWWMSYENHVKIKSHWSKVTFVSFCFCPSTVICLIIVFHETSIYGVMQWNMRLFIVWWLMRELEVHYLHWAIKTMSEWVISIINGSIIPYPSNVIHTYILQHSPSNVNPVLFHISFFPPSFLLPSNTSLRTFLFRSLELNMTTRVGVAQPNKKV